MMTRYELVKGSYNTKKLGNGFLIVSDTGDYAFLSDQELDSLEKDPLILSNPIRADLQSKFILRSKDQSGSEWLHQCRQAERSQTTKGGPSLHMLVVTLQCAHSCQYCQVSRSLEEQGCSMSQAMLEKACTNIFDSQNETITVEFQGGDPLLRFELVQYAIEKIKSINENHNKRIRFVVASTLHQLTQRMCEFFRENNVYLSTSIDGPPSLHNKNRPTPERTAYEKTVLGIQMAREIIGEESVSALMTTTRASLSFPNEIVDEYVHLGMPEIFIRPLSIYGFAKKNIKHIGYGLTEFMEFYKACLDRVLYWNRQGNYIREVYASIILNKLLSPFDAGYVDLQRPTGAGLSAIAYNYDGYIYPGDEARMLAETGDRGLRLGAIGTPISELLSSDLQTNLVRASLNDEKDECGSCVYKPFCAPNPIDAYAQHGNFYARPSETEHCQKHTMLFDYFFNRIKHSSTWEMDIFYNWAMPV